MSLSRIGCCPRPCRYQRCPAEAVDSRAPRAGFEAALMERCRVNSCVSRFSQLIDKKFDVVGGVIKI